MAITSKEINLSQLTRELGGKGLIANFEDSNNKLILPADGVTLTEKQLSDAIAAHVAVDEEAAKAEAKAALLERLGITAEEAKLLLS
jgi:ABC-type microcin C transport system duplicated ATPase subunit YejF